MTIKEVEKLVGITSANIRFYEKEGLFTPVRNTSNNYREYTERDVEDLKKIKVLRMLGVSIQDIKSAIDGEEKLTEIIQRRLEEIKQEEKHLKELEKVCQDIVEQNISFEMLDSGMINEKEEVWKDRLAYYIKQDITIEYVSPKQMNRTIGAMWIYMFFVNAFFAFRFGNYFLGVFENNPEYWGRLIILFLGILVFEPVMTGWTSKRYLQFIIFQIVTIAQIPLFMMLFPFIALLASLGTVNFNDNGPYALMLQIELSKYIGVIMLLMGIFILLLLVIYHTNNRYFEKARYSIPVFLLYTVVGTFVGSRIVENYIPIGIALFVLTTYFSVKWAGINVNGVERYNKYYAITSAGRSTNLVAQVFAGRYIPMEYGFGRYKK